MKQILLLLLPCMIFLLSCAGKRNYNKAQKLDEAGLYADAAELYCKSLKANKNNIDARLGLQRTGQMVLEDKVEVFRAQYNKGTAKDAVYAYREAESYYKRLSGIGVKLILPEEQKEYYLEVKDQYLDMLYRQASKALALDEFGGAEARFKEIITIDKNFKDAQTQWITAKYEPIYRRGSQLMGAEAFRSAYDDFNSINRATKGYKNSIELQAGCLDSATVSIVVLPFAYQYRAYRAFASSAKDRVVNSLSRIQSPFYKLISDEAVSSIPTLSEAKDPAKVVKYAKREDVYFEAKTILSARINQYVRRQGQLNKKEKRGYLKRTVEVVNAETKVKEQKVKYVKVRYWEYKMKNSVILSLSYELDRIDKDEIAVSDNFFGEEKSEVHYAQFEGDYKQLVPGYWKYQDKDSAEDQIYDSSGSNKQFHSLFKNSKAIVSIVKLENIILEKCGQHVAESISNYKPEN